MTADTQTQLDISAEPVTPSAGTSVPLNAFQLLEALRDHYLMPGHSRPGAVFLTEVTAPDRTHRADAIHVGLWASRGYTVDVCELKTSRADFMRELDKPDKAEAWWAHSNTFWIVAPNTTVAPPELLPPGWGLMVPGKGRRFKVMVKAEYRDLRPTTALLAALLVSMETDRNNAVQRERNRLETEHYHKVQEIRRQAAMDGAPPALRDRLKQLDQLEESIGFKLTGYDYGDDEVSAKTLGAALRAVVVEKKAAGGLGYILESLSREADRLKDAVTQAQKDIAGGAA